MSDDLTARLHALRAAATGLPEATGDPVGLADVRRRRDRRRNRQLAASATAVLGVLTVASITLHPLGDPTFVQPAGPVTSVPIGPTPHPRSTAPAEVTEGPAGISAATVSSGPVPPPAGGPGAGPSTAGGTTRATSVSPSSPTTSPASGTTSSGSPGTGVTGPPSPVTAALVGTSALSAAGVAVTGPAGPDPDAMPSLPPLCSAGSWPEEYSAPSALVSEVVPVAGGTVTEDVLSYAGPDVANTALVRLKDDARACPTINEFATISVTAVGSSIGEEFVEFALDAESGLDGSITRTWIVIARSGGVLVSMAGPTDTTARAAAGAGVAALG